ncbi:PREDICTED: uncharacterized protein LOC104603387 [Nelumbo nucifera]|uniref:Uncharacterized protein LOC104603387 n=2 Tax=Nelumbo nucifera TaxID=4432 RepID=A0A1U8AF97_NELNU|nr:PREDICTED: uncharacterized protein LOC104603387 [Nelumbo nucifera]DAD27320.1 TPA_asm: hypothetical protein HUJ06_028788 [Nelumbo nucifera]
MEDDHRNSSSSLKHKLRSSLCLSCCFPSGRREALEPDEKPRLIRASSSWLRSRTQELPEIKEKCRNLISRIGKGRRHSGDFRYDPLSYSLNFDEGIDDTQADDFPLRNFSARLPASPPMSTTKTVLPPVVVTSEITACS